VWPQLSATKRKGEAKMRFDALFGRVTRQSLVIAAMALGMSGVALADNDCSLRTLRGSYVFAASGYNLTPAGVPQPKAIVELINFNGDGTLSVPAATRSVNGVIARSPAGGTGSYTVEADCTGTIAFGGPNFDIFIAPRGEKLLMIQTNPDTVFQGVATKLSDLRRGE
jgi:hypothetical protein